MIAKVFVAAALFSCSSASVAAVELPRYKLTVGQQLTYRSTVDVRYEKHPPTKMVSQSIIWVVGQNEDGSWQVFVEHSMQSDGRKLESSLAYLDLTPDGGFKYNTKVGPRFDITTIFIPLPRDDSQRESDWQGTGKDGTVIQCRQASENTTADGYVVDFLRISASSRVSSSTSSGKATFDTNRGLIAEIHFNDVYPSGVWSCTTHGRTTLISNHTLPPGRLSVFRSEAFTYFEAAQQYDKLMAEALKSPEVDAILEAARKVLVDGKRGATQEAVTRQYGDRLAEHDNRHREYVDRARRVAQLVDQPAFDFVTTDFDGESHALEEYRGRIVILDFWYRECGWCIQAMPQIKQIVKSFSGQPVKVFGMNTDRNDDDAKHVIDAMQLNYDNLRAEGLADRFQVVGYPTLIIIDQRGLIRQVHVGYSSDLAEKVSNTVRQLIAESMHAPVQ